MQIQTFHIWKKIKFSNEFDSLSTLNLHLMMNGNKKSRKEEKKIE